MTQTVALTTQPGTLEQALASLGANKQRWAELAISQKIKYLEKIQERVYQTAKQQVELSILAKGNASAVAWESEEWLSGPVVTCRNIRVLLTKLKEIAVDHRSLLSNRQMQTIEGRLHVQVFPETLFDRIIYTGIKGEVWQQSDINLKNITVKMASYYQQKKPCGAISLVLGAGNVASIAPLDAIYKLFVEGQVVILKLNPVNAYLGSIWSEVFRCLIDEGFLQIAYGDEKVGQFLCFHSNVKNIHVTGSHKTYEAIYSELSAHKINKPITAELGNVSPIIVMPGKWSHKAIQFQAKNIASQLANNAGFNCNAGRVLILHDAWPQKQALIEAIIDVLRSIPCRYAYYPGAIERYQQYRDAHPQAIEVGEKKDKHLPWMIIPEVSPEASESICFKQEAFCSVMAQTSLKADSAQAFLRQAVQFCNKKLFGSLNVCILIDPKTEKSLKSELFWAINHLHYGTVAINLWPALGYALGTTTWGAYPGHHPSNIQSGAGVVHNAYMFDVPEKSVISGPFLMWPTPPWFVGNSNKNIKIAKCLLKYEYKPNIRNLLSVLYNAVI